MNDDTTPQAGTRAERNRDRRRRRGLLTFLRDVAIVLVLALALSFVLKTFLVRSFYIPSASMQPTLQVEDRIIVNQLVPAVLSLNRGDVIVFEDPGGWLTAVPQPQQHPIARAIGAVLEFVGIAPADSDEHLIKRVIGLPGDRVVCCDGSGLITVNGVAIDEPYIRVPGEAMRASREDFDVVVPVDSLWLLGDNRYQSADSRFNQDQPGAGFVPVDNVVGRAVVVNWPVSRVGGLDNHPEVFDGVPDADE